MSLENISYRKAEFKFDERECALGSGYVIGRTRRNLVARAAHVSIFRFSTAEVCVMIKKVGL
jgi:hypothetical protein